MSNTPLSAVWRERERESVCVCVCVSVHVCVCGECMCVCGEACMSCDMCAGEMHMLILFSLPLCWILFTEL